MRLLGRGCDSVALFNTGRLFDAPVEFFNLPTVVEVSRKGVILGELEVTGDEVGNVAVSGNQLTHQDGSAFLEPDLSHLFVGERQILDGNVFAFGHGNFSIGFEI